MKKQQITIQNPTGLSLKPTEQLYKIALRYKSHITFEYGGGTANAKSILSILGSGIKSGDTITLICDGDDEAAAMEEITRAIEEGLGE